jgi:hypothetical protein
MRYKSACCEEMVKALNDYGIFIDDDEFRISGCEWTAEFCPFCGQDLDKLEVNLVAPKKKSKSTASGVKA